MRGLQVNSVSLPTPSPGPRRLMKAPVAVHPLPQGGEGHPSHEWRRSTMVILALMGQRPRKTRHLQGPTLKGSNAVRAMAVLRPTPRGIMRPFQGREPAFVFSGGVAPGYFIVPL